LITGASDGIGAACARAFQARGAQLSLVARNAEKLREVGGPNALITPGDLKLPETRRAAVEATLARFGRIDVLVNNAGIGIYTRGWQAPLSDVRDMFELNLFAMLDMIELVTPHMQRQGEGSIVNVSSIAGRVSLPWFTTYSASKFAVCALTDGLRMELRKDGIHCMTVCPGYVKTGFQENALTGKAPASLWQRRTFAITKEQCAEAVVKGVERRARTVVTPRMGWALIWGRQLMPSIIDYFLWRIYRGLDFQAKEDPFGKS